MPVLESKVKLHPEFVKKPDQALQLIDQCLVDAAYGNKPRSSSNWNCGIFPGIEP